MMSSKSVAKVVTTVAVLGCGALKSSTALARPELQCNKAQTKCVTGGHDLTIGDQVGIYNKDGELVAKGEINAMRGDRRAILINERHGEIKRGYNLTLLSTGSDETTSNIESVRVYREPGKMAVGGSLGLGNWAIGESSPALEVSGFTQWRKWGGMLVIARGVYTAIEGEVTHYADDGLESRSISVSGIGALGGVGYILRENKPISFRGELGLGLMHVSANVGGNSDLVEDEGFDAKVKNGIGPYGRAALGAMWNLGAWHVHADVAPSLMHNAYGTVIAAGVSTDVK